MRGLKHPIVTPDLIRGEASFLLGLLHREAKPRVGHGATKVEIKSASPACLCPCASWRKQGVRIRSVWSRSQAWLRGALRDGHVGGSDPKPSNPAMPSRCDAARRASDPASPAANSSGRWTAKSVMPRPL